MVQTLSNSIVSGRVAHAFLFCGVRGVGKTTVARILAKSLNCTGRDEADPNPCNACTSCKEISSGNSVDVQEIDGASNTSVENIREINENIKYPPVASRYKIIIIDEVHMISINAFNALLKTLEEPPPHVKFIFATTESHKVPPTINSRCQRFNFRTISVKEIADGMEKILVQEGIQSEEEALILLAREAGGSFRDGLSLLDQIIAFSSQRITVQDVTQILGIVGKDCFGKLVTAVLDRDPSESLKIIHELFQQGFDPEQIVMDLIQYVRNLIVARSIPRNARTEGLIEAPPSEVQDMENIAGRSSPQELQNLFSILLKSEGEIRRSGNPWVTMEMTVLKMAYAPELIDLAEIIRRIDKGLPANPKPGPSSQTPPRSKKAETGTPRSVVAVPDAPSDSPEDIPSETFTITQIMPLPSGSPDDVWAELKGRFRSENESILPSVMDHGNLLLFGPTEVEIGFTKKIHKESFESRLSKKPELGSLLKDFFGGANIKILTLTAPTSLDTKDPYAGPSDGESDFNRALKTEAVENPMIKAILSEFDGSFVEDIKILALPKT